MAEPKKPVAKKKPAKKAYKPQNKNTRKLLRQVDGMYPKGKKK